MKIKDMTQAELELLSHCDLTALLLKENKKPMNTAAIFQKICELLGYSEDDFANKIGDYYTSLTTDKRFILLDSAEWDLRDNHSVKIDIDMEDEDEMEEEEIDEEVSEDEIEEEDIESLLVQQIEFCSTLVINKIDLVSKDELDKVRMVVNALHPGAKVIETSQGDVEVKDILNTRSFDFDEVYESAGWCQALSKEGELGDEEDENNPDHEHHHDHDEHEEHEHHHDHDEHEDHEHHHDHDEHEEHGHHHDHHHHHEHRHEGESEDEYGIGTFIYYRRTPFDREKLRAYVPSWPKNIIRCKGTIWFSDEDDMAYVLETSGRQLLCGAYGKWVATAPEFEKKRLLEENPQIAADWDEKVGDRMVRLCIIGRNLDKKAIAKELDELLAK